MYDIHHHCHYCRLSFCSCFSLSQVCCPACASLSGNQPILSSTSIIQLNFTRSISLLLFSFPNKIQGNASAIIVVFLGCLVSQQNVHMALSSCFSLSPLSSISKVSFFCSCNLFFLNYITFFIFFCSFG